MRKLYPTRFGFMLVNELDAYVGRSLIAYGEFSPGEARLFSDLIRTGMVVVDVGANLGAHTLLFAKLVGPGGAVHAYEPQRLVFQMLCANVALNALDNVFCRQEAVGDSAGTVLLGTPDPDTVQNFGGYSLADLTLAGGEAVRVGPLDVDCHFLKIDVEGMEAEVLTGAAGLIRRCRPLMYVENDRAENSARLIECIESLGYTPFWHVTPLFYPDNHNGNTTNVFDGNPSSFNLLCLPNERSDIRHDLDRAVENAEQYIQRKQRTLLLAS